MTMAPSGTSQPHCAAQPPVPFADFQFAFDPSTHPLFPGSLPVPPSADLFSPSETTNLFGFLDNFKWEFDVDPASVDQNPNAPPSLYDLYSSSSPSAEPAARASPSSSSSRDTVTADACHDSGGPSRTRRRSASPRSPEKHLLSTPQKRMNHILSEQKRRNAIRDGYAQLTALLAPAGAPPGTGLPTRGRPKGSGARRKGPHGKGKSGVLLRAVEYCRWLEEGRDALVDEVRRVEAAAGIRIDPFS